MAWLRIETMRIDGWGLGRFWKILECEWESLGGGLRMLTTAENVKWGSGQEKSGRRWRVLVGKLEESWTLKDLKDTQPAEESENQLASS
jgi:hypothetical protein